MAPRTIHTLGGRYKTIDAVEDAPFGDFITVRDTGLSFNVVHPIPVQYIRELSALERKKVRDHIASQLSSGGYKGDRFVKAATQSVITLDEVQRERAPELPGSYPMSTKSTNTSTTDTSTTNNSTANTESDATVRPATRGATQQGATSGIDVSGLYVTMGALNIEPAPQPPIPECHRSVDEWEEAVPAGLPPPSVSEPSDFTRSTSDNTSLPPSPTRSRQPTRHNSFVQDPSLNEDARKHEAVEHHTSDQELALHEGHLESLALFSSSMNDLAAILTLNLAINRARAAVTDLRGSEIVTKAELANARDLTVAAMNVADSVREKTAREIKAVSLEVSTSPSPEVQPDQRSTPAPTPRETQRLSPSPPPTYHAAEVDRIEDELRGINDDLVGLIGTINDTMSWEYLRARVIESVDQALECIDVGRSGGVRQGSLDHALIQEFGQDVLENARKMQERAMSVLAAAQEEEAQLHDAEQGPQMAERTTAEREAEEAQRRRRDDIRRRDLAAQREMERQQDLADRLERRRQRAESFHQAAHPTFYNLAAQRYLESYHISNQLLRGRGTRPHSRSSNSGFYHPPPYARSLYSAQPISLTDLGLPLSYIEAAQAARRRRRGANIGPFLGFRSGE